MVLIKCDLLSIICAQDPLDGTVYQNMRMGSMQNSGIESYIAIVPRSLTLMLLKEASWARERLNFPDTEHGAVSSDMKMHD